MIVKFTEKEGSQITFTNFVKDGHREFSMTNESNSFPRFKVVGKNVTIRLDVNNKANKGFFRFLEC